MTINTTFPQLILRSDWEQLLRSSFAEDYNDNNYPFTDVYKNEDGDTIIECALAGFSKDALSVEKEDNKITISGSAPDQSKVVGTRRIARRGFRKSYVDTTGLLDLDSMTASFSDGLLKVQVPKAEKAKKKTVSIV